MYKLDEDKPFGVTLKFLNLMYIYPAEMEDRSYMKTFLIKFCIIKLLCCIITFIVPVFHLITSVNDGIYLYVNEDVALICGAMGAQITSLLFLIQSKKWSQFFSDVTNFKTFGDFSNFAKVKKRLDLFSKMCFYILVTGTITYGLTSLGQTGPCHEINKLGTRLIEVCGAFVPVRLPFDVNPLWAKVLIFLTQFLFVFAALMPGACICNLVFESAEILMMHICMVKRHFEDVFNTEIRSESCDRLRFCIQYHKHIIGLTTTLNYLTKYTCGHLCFLSALIFATFGKQMLSAKLDYMKPIACVIPLAGYVLGLFLLCHAGQKLSDETSTIGLALYKSKWYEGHAKIMKDVLLVLLKCEKPAIMEAVPLGTLDYPLFLLILKSSYSYLTLMNQNM